MDKNNLKLIILYKCIKANTIAFVPKSTECYRDVNLIVYHCHMAAYAAHTTTYPQLKYSIRLIWVCLQQPSWTLDMHLQRYQTGYPSVVSSLLRIGGSRRERGRASTVGAGDRERGRASTVGAAAAAPRSHWKSQPLLLLCALWHCDDEGKGHGVPSFGGAGTKLGRPSGDSDARTTPQWLSVCPREGWWRYGPIFQRN